MEYKEYIKLTEAKSIIYAEKVLNEITDEDELVEILTNLTLFTNGKCLQKLYPKLIEKKIFYPWEIYMHADEEIGQKLINLIETQHSTINVNHVLICLAWIGTKNVIDFLQSTSETKPIWTKDLYVTPIQYSDHAGWVIDKFNNKRKLFNLHTLALTKNKRQFDKQKPMQTFKQHDDNCPFCKTQLTTVFSVQLNSDNYATQFTTCLLCTCYDPIFMTVDNEGKSSWHNGNTKWEHLRDDMEMDTIPENILQVSTEQRKAVYGIGLFSEISKSQIGGYPSWVQDAEYLDCRSCEQKMTFIGQIDMEDVDDGEGIYYFHHCEECKLVATNYQQT